MNINWTLLLVVVLLTLRRRLLKSIGFDTKIGHGVYIAAMAGLLTLGYMYPPVFNLEGLLYKDRISETIDKAVTEAFGSKVSPTGRFDFTKRRSGKFYERDFEMVMELKKKGREYIMAGWVSCTPVAGCRFSRGPVFLDKRFVERKAGGNVYHIYDPDYLLGSYMRDKMCADYRVLQQVKEKLGERSFWPKDVDAVGERKEAAIWSSRAGYKYIRSCDARILFDGGHQANVAYDVFEDFFGKPEVFVGKLWTPKKQNQKEQ
ncbi:hypothetical protein [Hydrogenimonas sp.]